MECRSHYETYFVYFSLQLKYRFRRIIMLLLEACQLLKRGLLYTVEYFHVLNEEEFILA